MPGNANKTNIIAGLFKAFAFETITVDNTVKSLTAATYKVDSGGEKAKRALITCEDAQIRYLYTGGTPTASVAHILNPMDVLVLTGSDNISNFKCIRKGSVSGTLMITYEN